MAAVRYPTESFTDAEREALAPHFTNLDGPVFALVNLPETVKGALFARYSRYAGSLRRLYLDEFAGEVPEGGRPFDGIEGERAAGLYERIFVGYGDDDLGDPYRAALDEIFGIYSRSLSQVEGWAAEHYPRGDEPERAWRGSIRAKALDLLRGLLPAATLSHVGIFASGQA
jgi:thymidylate synthase ThyX